MNAAPATNSAAVTPTGRATPPRVVVIGGGLAGIAAAVALADAGCAVALLEARRSLGGRAGSYQDPQTGETLDNCQHVLLGCCTNLIDLYRRIGAGRHVRWDGAITFLDAAGRAYRLTGTPGLPAPLHLGPALLRFGLLSIAERLALSRAMLAMMRLDAAARLRLLDVPLGDWLDAQAQPASLVGKLYDPVIVSALNEDTRRVSAAYAIQVFQASLLSNAAGYVMGVPGCPLGELYDRPSYANPHVDEETRGQGDKGTRGRSGSDFNHHPTHCSTRRLDVRLGTRVARLLFAPHSLKPPDYRPQTSSPRLTGVKLLDGTVLEADAVILATGHHAARRLVPDDLAARDARFRVTTGLEDVPILGVHLTFDHPVMPDHPHVALTRGPLQWLFRKDPAGRTLHGVISAARLFLGRPHGELLPLFESQIRAVLPRARDARLERGTVVIEKRATFSPLPGSDRHRPPQTPPPGGVANLFLAGDYTQTGWPATMEGAVRSGYLAAEGVLGSLSVPSGATPTRPHLVVPDLPPQWPARWVTGRR